MVLVGALFMLVGLVDFFSAFNASRTSSPFGSSGPFSGVPNGPVIITGEGFSVAPRGPQKFWCFFVGMPLIAIGVGICKFAFMGTVARYVASETAPVAADTFNYVASETQSGVRTLTSAVAAGLDGRSADDGATTDDKTCPGCQALNEHDSRFCDQCGESLPVDLSCPACQRRNAPDARFCDSCGTGLDV